jgi:tRNA A37 threonylcarbamoyladenosine dehydratase
MSPEVEPFIVPVTAVARGPEAGRGNESPYEVHRRFDRMARLVGEPALERLFRSHVMIIGLGGVGSFAAESLVRSGVGRVSLVDFDKVCVTNCNRQLQAIKGNVGRSKAESLAERLRLANPQAQVDPVVKFYSEATSEELLSLMPDYVVDAIDNLTAKSHLLATCRVRSIPLVTSLGAAGRIDPSQIMIADLARTKFDPMGRVIRKILRQNYDFPKSGLFGISAVYSTEGAREPEPVTYDGGLGFRCVCPGGSNDFHSCDKRRVIYGTSSFVTGSFGLFCASVAVRSLIDANDSDDDGASR